MIESLPPPPRIKPAITISLPVLTKARVLMFPSFDRPGLKVVDFHQTNSGHIRVPTENRGVGPGSSVARIADSRSFVGAIPVA